MTNAEIFKTLSELNVNEKTEEKNGLTYLSWAWAWAEFKKICPDATYEVVKFDGLPYAYDEHTGYMVYTRVTAGDLTHEMWLPVMDGANKAMKSEEYWYTVKNPKFKYAKRCEDGKYRDSYGREQKEYVEKNVDPATMFDINKAIMRCLTKNLAMFGLGLYIYAGEDLPESEKPEDPEWRCGTCGKPFEPYVDDKGKTLTATQMYLAMKRRSEDGIVRCPACYQKTKENEGGTMK